MVPTGGVRLLYISEKKTQYMGLDATEERN